MTDTVKTQKIIGDYIPVLYYNKLKNLEKWVDSFKHMNCQKSTKKV